jgi:hypothetical protein
MPNFAEKAIFIWCYWDILGGDVHAIAAALVDAGFEAAYVHTNDGPWEGSYGQMQPDGSYVDRVNCTPELVDALRSRGLAVYGWGAPYGTNTTGEISIMVSQTERYNLDGYVIDAEGRWDAQGDVLADTRRIITEYKAACPGKPVAWCWWPMYQSLSGGTWHNKEILRLAMIYADYGMPMAYWNWGDSVARVEAYLNESVRQWKVVTTKPLITAGRAYLDQYGSPTYEAVTAFDRRSRELGVIGITWWDMQHAIRLESTWSALRDTPKFGEEVEMTDWTQNAIGLYASSKAAAGWSNPAFNFAVGFAGGNWTVQNNQYVLEPNPDLAPMEKLAHDKSWPFIALWDFNVGWYTNQQIIADDAHWPSEAADYPLQRMIAALQSRSVDGLIIRVLNRRDLFDTKNELMSYVAYAAGRFVERANRWLYTNKGLDKWTFVLTNDAFMRQDGAQENFYSWLKNWWLGIEKQAITPLANGAWPQPTDAPGAIPPSQGWKWWYHYNAASLDMLIYNGTNQAMLDFLSFDQAPVDVVAPSAPTNLAVGVSGSTVNLSWSASTDNVAVTAYEVSRDGVLMTTATSLSASLLGEVPGTHTYSVVARDAAGNKSPAASITATVQDGGSGETDLDVILREIQDLDAAIADLTTKVSALDATVDQIAADVSYLRGLYK